MMDDTTRTADTQKANGLVGGAAVLADKGGALFAGGGDADPQLANALKMLAPGMQGLALSSGSPPTSGDLHAQGAPPEAARRPRVTFSDAPSGAPPPPPDSDAAKRAVGAALAGLDLASARVNLDASKAAVSAMRASGELPAHPPRKTGRELRSASARQLNYPTAGAAPLKHNLPLGAGLNGGAAAGGAGGVPGLIQEDALSALRGPNGARRAPPGRSISMPFVMQGRAGMQARLNATLAQDAALQQQLHLLQGGAGAASVLPGAFGASLDDSMLPGLGVAGRDSAAQSLLLQQQLHQHHQQQQQQQAALANAQMRAQMHAAQLQAAQFAAPASAGLDSLWGTAAGAALPMAAPVAAAPMPPGLVAAAPQPPPVDAAALVESYGSASWQLLALAHANGGAASAQLSQELSLLAAAAAAFSALGTSDPAHAAADLALVAAAAQSHVALYALSGGLSAPAGAAVRLLAAFAGPLAHPPGAATAHPELLDASFAVVNALSAASPELSAFVTQHRAAALTAPPALGPDAEVRLLQRQATGRQALAALAGVVERNQQLVATMAAGGGAGGGAPAAASALVSAASAPAPLSAGAGGGAVGHSPVPTSLSPTRGTPLASYFAGGSGPLDGIALPPAAVGCYSPQQGGSSYSTPHLSRELPGLVLDAQLHARRASAGGGGGAAAAPGGGLQLIGSPTGLGVGVGGVQMPGPAQLGGVQLPHLQVSLPLA